MKLGDSIRYAFGHIRRHRLRTGLTSCGVAVGIGTLTLLVSLGQGLQELVEDQFDKADLVTRVLVTPEGGKGKVLRGAAPSGSTGAPITSETLEQLAKIEGVKTAYMLTQAAVVGEHEGMLSLLPIDGVPPEALGEAHQEALIAGRYWTRDDAGAVCVLPSNLLKELGFADAQAAVGAELHVSGLDAPRRYKRVEVRGDDGEVEGFRFERPPGLETILVQVVGVFRSQDFGQFGSFVQCPLELATRLARELNAFRMGGDEMALVKVARARDVERVAKDVEKLGYETITVFDQLRQIRIVFLVITVILGLFGSIGLVVSLFGIANTMVMAVLERTREIGVLKALGARQRDIRRMFLAEAGAIGGIGGTLGIAAAWAFGQLLNVIANHALKDQLEEGTYLAFFHIPVVYGVGILGLSIGVAAFAGFWPAMRAARLDPVVALRLE